MLARVSACFVLSAISITSAQDAKTREPQVVTLTVPGNHPVPKTQLELEELRANPPKNWAAQRQHVDECLLAAKLANPVHPSTVVSARQKYPSLAAARTKLIEAETAWERLAWKDDEFLQIRSNLAMNDEYLTKSGFFVGPAMRGHLSPVRIEERIRLSEELGKVEQRLAANEESRKLIAQREQERSAYTAMLEKLEEIGRAEREKERAESAARFAKELKDQEEHRTILPGRARNLPEDQLPPAERSAMKTVASLQRQVDELSGVSPRASGVTLRPTDTPENARRRVAEAEHQAGNDWMDQLSAARGRLARAQAKLAELQRQRAKQEQGE